MSKTFLDKPLTNQIEVIENILKDAQSSIQFCSSHFSTKYGSTNEIGFTNDDLIQSIDECEIFINDALEEIGQLKYHYNSEEALHKEEIFENQKYQNDVIPAEESSLYDEEFSFQDHEDEAVGPKTGYEY